MLRRLLFVAYFLEVGLLLMLVPWSTFWERNYFVALLPALEPVVSNHYVRGAVTGLGIVNVCAALAELAGIVSARAPFGRRSVTQVLRIDD